MAQRSSSAAALLIGFIFVCLFSRAVSAQGWLSGPAGSSLGSASDLSISDDFTQVGVGVVYSANGAADFGFGVAQAWLDESDLKATIFGLNMMQTYAPLEGPISDLIPEE
jgi:hypothetical protein